MDPQIAFIQGLQTGAPGLGPFMEAVAFLGQPEFYLLFIPLILWCYDRSLGLRLLMLIPINGALSDAFKIFFHSPRPYWVSTGVKALTNYPSFGFPSAHAQNAVVFFGYLASTLKKRMAWIVCIVMILLIGLARVYQGVHFPPDILGGYAFGLVMLVIFLRYETTVSAWLKSKPAAMQIGIAFAASCALVLISLAALLSLGSWQMPADWAVLALAQTGIPIEPLVPRDTLVAAGLLFGSAAGAVLAEPGIGNGKEGRFHHKAVRYGVGILVLFSLWVLLGLISPASGMAEYLMEYLSPAIAGLWITAGAPLLFRRLGLSA